MEQAEIDPSHQSDSIGKAIRYREFWLHLAWIDIRGRYRRTFLGPFWSVLNSLIFIGVIGSIYRFLWQASIEDFLPFLAAGYFTWMFFSACISESCASLTAYGETIKTVKVPPFAMIMRVIVRNIIVMAHNLLIFVFIAAIFSTSLLFAPLAVIGLLIVATACTGLGFLAAMISARYRDIQQVVTSLLQILFFSTPIIWSEKLLPSEASILADINPVFHLLVIVRDPLLGNLPPVTSYGVALVVAALSIVLAEYYYTRCQRYLPFWI